MIEPSADARTSARSLREWYEALVMVGFTEQQAMTVLVETIRANAISNRQRP